MLRTISLFALLVLVIAACQGVGLAGDLPVVNGSFELPAADSSWIATPAGDYPYPCIVPTGWQGRGEMNVNRLSSIAFPGGAPDGAQVGVVGDDIGNGLLWQDIHGVALTANVTYTLSAFVGSRADFPGSGIVSLKTTSDSLLATSGVVAPADGTFSHVTFSYTASAGNSHLGEGLRIVLERAGGHQASFDAIAMSSVPEPSAVIRWLSLGAVGAVVTWRWRRKVA